MLQSDFSPWAACRRNSITDLTNQQIPSRHLLDKLSLQLISDDISEVTPVRARTSIDISYYLKKWGKGTLPMSLRYTISVTLSLILVLTSAFSAAWLGYEVIDTGNCGARFGVACSESMGRAMIAFVIAFLGLMPLSKIAWRTRKNEPPEPEVTAFNLVRWSVFWSAAMGGALFSYMSGNHEHGSENMLLLMGAVLVAFAVSLFIKRRKSSVFTLGDKTTISKNFTDLNSSEVRINFTPEGTTFSSSQPSPSPFSFKHPDSSASQDTSERLKRLDNLRKQGAITQAEYARERERILGQI